MSFGPPGRILCGFCGTCYHGSRTVVIDKSGNTCSGNPDGVLRIVYGKPLINIPPIDYRL
jgi:hypothetical protein